MCVGTHSCNINSHGLKYLFPVNFPLVFYISPLLCTLVLERLSLIIHKFHCGKNNFVVVVYIRLVIGMIGMTYTMPHKEQVLREKFTLLLMNRE